MAAKSIGLGASMEPCSTCSGYRTTGVEHFGVEHKTRIIRCTRRAPRRGVRLRCPELKHRQHYQATRPQSVRLAPLGLMTLCSKNRRDRPTHRVIS